MQATAAKDLSANIKKLKKGNEKAAKALFNSFSKMVYTAVLHLTQDQAVAQDLLQETFIKAFDEIDQLKEATAFGGWIKRIAINKALQHQRKNERGRVLSLNDQPIDFEDEEYLEEKVSAEMLHKAIFSLPDGCREVFRLFYLDDYSHQEIAEVMAISTSTSKSQLHRAKSLLRTSLKQHFYNEN